MGEIMFDNPSFDNHEDVHFFSDADSGLRAIIAIHSTALGPSSGGTRMWDYATSANMVTDALRLSQGMSYKNAMASIAHGGGKAVIWGNSKTDKSDALFRAFGRAVGVGTWRRVQWRGRLPPRGARRRIGLLCVQRRGRRRLSPGCRRNDEKGSCP